MDPRLTRSRVDALASHSAAESVMPAARVDIVFASAPSSMPGRAIAADPDNRALRLLLLTSVGNPAGDEELRRLGIEFVLSKPVREAHLHQSLAALRALPNSAPEAGARPSAPQHRRYNARILLAEDNRVNQEVVTAILAIYGLRVEVVGNGREAVAAWRAGRYDLVLMDCQMPEMDGYEATRTIREEEAGGARGGRTPIVALTAHALEGDREKSLAAGMDDHLSKPFRINQLEAVLERWLSAAEAPATALVAVPATPAAPTQEADLLNSEALESLRDIERQGASGVVRKTVAFYLEDAPTLLQTIRDAVDRAEPEALRRAAHSLKSASANLGALRLMRLCQHLEHLGASGGVEGAAAVAGDAAAEFEKVRSLLVAAVGRGDV